MSRSGRPLLGLVAALAAGCGASVFAYDPAGTNEPNLCLTDADCLAGRCDAGRGRCVPCLVDDHCGDDARVCRANACVLAEGRCATDADCDSIAGRPRCAVQAKRCVQCADEHDCGGLACEAGACAAPTGCTPAGPALSDRLSVGAVRVQRAETSGRDYAACVAAGCCAPLPDAAECVSATDGERPVNCVALADAIAFCRYVGGRVPSGGEWTLAAGGDAEDRFPWGAAPATCDVAVMATADEVACGGSGPAAACSKPAGNSAGGICDLGGNLWEWTQEAVAGRRVLRGGSFATQNREALRNRFRSFSEDPARRLVDAGIRCVW